MTRKCLVEYQNQPYLAGHADIYVVDELPRPGRYPYKELRNFVTKHVVKKIGYVRATLSEILERRTYDNSINRELGECGQTMVAIIIGKPYHLHEPLEAFVEHAEKITTSSQIFHGETIAGSYFWIHIPYSRGPVKPTISITKSLAGSEEA